METAHIGLVASGAAASYGRGLLWKSAGLWLFAAALTWLFLLQSVAFGSALYARLPSLVPEAILLAILLTSLACSAQGQSISAPFQELVRRSRNDLVCRAAFAEAAILGLVQFGFIVLAWFSFFPGERGAYLLFLHLSLVWLAAGLLGEYRSRWWEKSAPLAI